MSNEDTEKDETAESKPTITVAERQAAQSKPTITIAERQGTDQQEEQDPG